MAGIVPVYHVKSTRHYWNSVKESCILSIRYVVLSTTATNLLTQPATADTTTQYGKTPSILC